MEDGSEYGQTLLYIDAEFADVALHTTLSLDSCPASRGQLHKNSPIVTHKPSAEKTAVVTRELDKNLVASLRRRRTSCFN